MPSFSSGRGRNRLFLLASALLILSQAMKQLARAGQSWRPLAEITAQGATIVAVFTGEIDFGRTVL